MRVSSHTSDYKADSFSITFEGTKEEISKIEGALISGTHWVRGGKGKHKFVGAYLPAPLPIDDPLICVQWPSQPERQTQLIRTEGPKRRTLDNKATRNIYIWYIGGYGGSIPYQDRVRTLEAWGFSCMRSQRGLDGKIWECWFLGGMMLAKGDLKGTPIEDVVHKIFKYINPGVLEFAGERWCLTID